VVNGTQTSFFGPLEIARLLPPGGLAENCDLLPQGLSLADVSAGAANAADEGMIQAGAGASEVRRLIVTRVADAKLGAAAAARIAKATQLTLDLDSASGQPARAAFTAATGENIEVRYSEYKLAGGVPFPAHVEKRVSGQLRLTVELEQLSARADFSERDFPIAARPTRAKRQSGGGG